MNTRLETELALLRSRYPDIEYREEGDWFLIPCYKVPEDKWAMDHYAIAFQLRAGYPEVGPYSFYANPRPRGRNDNKLSNYVEPGDPPPPFEGEWGRFSWQLPAWKASPDISRGTNLLNFVDSFRGRFEEGP